MLCCPAAQPDETLQDAIVKLLELGWQSKDIAAKLGVDEGTFCGWKTGKTTPGKKDDILVKLKKLLEGPVPATRCWDAIDKLLELGWQSKDIAAKLGVDEGTFCGWKTGKTTPGKKDDILVKLKKLLEGPVPVAMKKTTAMKKTAAMLHNDELNKLLAAGKFEDFLRSLGNKTIDTKTQLEATEVQFWQEEKTKDVKGLRKLCKYFLVQNPADGKKWRRSQSAQSVIGNGKLNWKETDDGFFV